MRGHAEIACLGPRVSDPTWQACLYGSPVTGGIEGNENAFPFVSLGPEEGSPGSMVRKGLERATKLLPNDLNLDVSFVAPCTKDVALEIAKFDYLWINQVDLASERRTR